MAAGESDILFNLLECRYFYWLVEPKFEVQKLPFFWVVGVTSQGGLTQCVIWCRQGCVIGQTFGSLKRQKINHFGW